MTNMYTFQLSYVGLNEDDDYIIVIVPRGITYGQLLGEMDAAMDEIESVYKDVVEDGGEPNLYEIVDEELNNAIVTDLGGEWHFGRVSERYNLYLGD